MPETTYIPVDVIEAFIVDVFTGLGVPQDKVQISADVLITSDLRGIESHGVGLTVTNARPSIAPTFGTEPRPDPGQYGQSSGRAPAAGRRGGEASRVQGVRAGGHGRAAVCLAVRRAFYEGPTGL